MDPKRQRELKSMADDENLTLSYGIGLKNSYDVSSLDEKVRQRGLDFMKKMIDSVANMGGGMIGVQYMDVGRQRCRIIENPDLDEMAARSASFVRKTLL